MRILFLTLADVDDRSYGGALRSHAMRAALQRVGDVDTLVIHGGPAARLDLAWTESRVRTAIFSRSGLGLEALRQRRRIGAWVAGVLRETAYDAIVARYLGLAVHVPRRDWQRLLLDADDIVKHPPVAASWRQRMRLALRNAVALRSARRARHVWLVNPQDAPGLAAPSVSALGNVIGLPPIGRTREPAVPRRLLMVAYFAHPPNAEGLRFLAAEVLPELARRFPGLELHAVGKHPPGFEREFAAPVRLRGFVADLAAEYDRAQLVVAPIRSGAGTQIKVLDALAHGRPLLASRFAQAGFSAELRDREHLRVAGDAAEWIACCTSMLEHPEEARTLASRGEDAVRRAYGPEQMAKEVRRRVRELVASSKEALA